jgi:RNA polymerase sigma factor (sigma-70 family)
VLKAVRNAAIDLRQQQNRLGSGTIDKWDLLPETITPPPDRSDRANAVYAELLRLKQTTQEIIQLHIHEQLSFREIGELLDLPLQTVASRYRRGLKQIEQNVRDHDRAD